MLATPSDTFIPTPIPSSTGYRPIPTPRLSTFPIPDLQRIEHELARAPTPSQPRMMERYLRDGTSLHIGTIPVFDSKGHNISPTCSAMYANDFNVVPSTESYDAQAQAQAEAQVQGTSIVEPQQLLRTLQEQRFHPKPPTPTPNPTQDRNQNQLQPRRSQPTLREQFNNPQYPALQSRPQSAQRQQQQLTPAPARSVSGNQQQNSADQIQRRQQQELNWERMQRRASQPQSRPQSQPQLVPALQQQQQYQYQQHPQHLPYDIPQPNLDPNLAQLPPTPVSAISQPSLSMFPPPSTTPQPMMAQPPPSVLLPHYEPFTGLTSWCTIDQLVQQRLQAAAAATGSITAQEVQALRDELRLTKTNYDTVWLTNDAAQAELLQLRIQVAASDKQTPAAGQEGSTTHNAGGGQQLQQEVEAIKANFNRLLTAYRALGADCLKLQQQSKDMVGQQQVEALKKENETRRVMIVAMGKDQQGALERADKANIESATATLALANFRSNKSHLEATITELRKENSAQSARLVEANAAAVKAQFEIFALQAKINTADERLAKESQESGTRIDKLTNANHILSERIKIFEAVPSINRPDTPPLPTSAVHSDPTPISALLEAKTRTINDLQLDNAKLQNELAAVQKQLEQTKTDLKESRFPWEGLCATGDKSQEQEERIKNRLLSQEKVIQDLSAEKAALVLELDRTKNAFELERVNEEWMANRRERLKLQSGLEISIDIQPGQIIDQADAESTAKECECQVTIAEIIIRSEKVFVGTLTLSNYVKTAAMVKVDEAPLADVKVRKAGEMLVKNSERIEGLVRYAREVVPISLAK